MIETTIICQSCVVILSIRYNRFYKFLELISRACKPYDNVIFDKKMIDICKRNYITKIDHQK